MKRHQFTTTCPHCGGKKGRKAAQCRECFTRPRPLIDNGNGTHSVPLADGRLALVDSIDADAIGRVRWYVNTAEGRPDYADSRLGYLHRVILNAGPGDIVDHANGDTFDNRRENLRFATHQQNMSNSIRRKALSGYKGVFLRCDGKKWVARIQVHKRGVYLGSFETPEDAARAYDSAAIKHFGEFANLNFPDAA